MRSILTQPLTWFEIPVADMDRAVAFYNAVLELALEATDFEGVTMAFFPMQESHAGGALFLEPKAAGQPAGVMIYLNGGEDLQAALDRVPQAGGTVLVPKTPIGQDMGYFAHFKDTEGNTLGLSSSG